MASTALFSGICFMVWLLQLFPSATRCSKDVEDYLDSKPEKSSQVEVRAVFISCEPNDGRGSDSQNSRFQRQELFKHNALQDCTNKLALTVKMASDSNQSPGDEYIPIDHVFEGMNKKRVRLLNPYVLRLKREPPIQAYKLRRIDTVNGVLTNTDKGSFGANNNIQKKSREQRDLNRFAEVDEWSQQLDSASVFTLDHEEPGRNSYSVRISDMEGPARRPAATSELRQISKDCGLKLFSQVPTNSMQPPRTSFDASQTERQPSITLVGRLNDKYRVKRQTCSKSNETLIRDKRYEQNISGARNNITYQSAEDRYYQKLHTDISGTLDETAHESSNANYEDQIDEKELVKPIEINQHTHSKNKERNIESEAYHTNMKTDSMETLYVTGKSSSKASSIDNSLKSNKDLHNSYDFPNEELNDRKGHFKNNDERDYALYEIGDPNLWYKVHVQLFEKISTDGNTMWNDITKGEHASVSASNPEWMNHEMNVRYRPAEWVGRDDFSLPMASLCLLVPIRGDSSSFDNDTSYSENSNLVNEEYIVVPVEDVVGLDGDGSNLIKRNDNYSDSSSNVDEEAMQPRRRRVEVRVTRALFGGRADKFGLASLGPDQFLTLPHTRPHLAQIDLEVRADDNQLIRVGSSGCIAQIVADNTRKSRAILTLQATNTGLASARFRVMAHDCGPELSGLINEKCSEGISAGPVLLPPRQTRRLRLEIPIELPVDIAHCSVALVNDDDETVAVRDVAIKKGDRCFCVWHCECVCLGEDPKLLCREMSPSQLSAAGLPERERARRARSACYADNIVINMSVVVVGVMFLLLSVGFLKACLGLKCRCVALWGLDRILELPRKLNHYYEASIRCRKVEYDFQGWPIHPDTRKRTVLPISRATLFVLNLTFFVTAPCLTLRAALSKLVAHCRTCAHKAVSRHNDNNTKKCFSSHDMQSVELQLRRRRRPGLRRWMTPHAEELSGHIWQRQLDPQGTEETMTPLLRDECCSGRPKCDEQQSIPDSEQDDTQYVLTQMQKSRESLARTHKKQTEDGMSSRKNRKGNQKSCAKEHDKP